MLPAACGMKVVRVTHLRAVVHVTHKARISDAVAGPADRGAPWVVSAAHRRRALTRAEPVVPKVVVGRTTSARLRPVIAGKGQGSPIP